MGRKERKGEDTGGEMRRGGNGRGLGFGEKKKMRWREMNWNTKFEF